MGVYEDMHCYLEHLKQSRWQGIEPKKLFGIYERQGVPWNTGKIKAEEMQKKF